MDQGCVKERGDKKGDPAEETEGTEVGKRKKPKRHLTGDIQQEEDAANNCSEDEYQKFEIRDEKKRETQSMEVSTEICGLYSTGAFTDRWETEIYEDQKKLKCEAI